MIYELILTHCLALFYWVLKLTNANSIEISNFSILVCDVIIINLCLIYTSQTRDIILPLLINLCLFIIKLFGLRNF
jgi:hypothetical protein